MINWYFLSFHPPQCPCSVIPAKGVMWQPAFICLFICQQTNAKSYERILIPFFKRNRWLHFGGVPDSDGKFDQGLDHKASYYFVQLCITTAYTDILSILSVSHSVLECELSVRSLSAFRVDLPIFFFDVLLSDLKRPK